MKTTRWLATMLLPLALLIGCATAAGGLIGAGVDKASGGDGTAGAMIGGGVGMMIDVFN
ncbi:MULTISPECIES: hypothetical protein [unclassified Achromobacter]|uniref:hypothetical protein n=1 Tax=unclassified Achromobacter TaxID=2626865 RepID=UPI000B04D1F1|nr:MULTISPECIES: hypothetical protein [unclassified Achromobacter]